VIPVSLRPKGEPRLGEYGLYKAFGEAGHTAEIQTAVMWILNQADGTTDLQTIAVRSGIKTEILHKAMKMLCDHGLMRQSTD
jgi:aminopeptidase-like protein